MQEIATFFGLFCALMAMPTVTEARRRALFSQCPLMQFMPGAVVVPRPKRGQKRAAPPYLVHGAAGAAEDVTSRDVWGVRDAAKRFNPGAESDRRGVPTSLHPADVAVKRARASEDTGTQCIEGTPSPRKARVRTETASSIAATEQAAAAELAPLPKGKATPKVRRRQALTFEEDDMIEAANVQTESFRQNLRLCLQRVHTMPAVKGGVLVPAASAHLG